MALMTYRFRKMIHENKFKLSAIEVELGTLLPKAPSDQSELEKMLADWADEVAAVKDIERRAFAGLRKLQDKQDEIIARGSDVLSIRSTATVSPRVALGGRRQRLRVLVPKERPVWLHLGVTKQPVDTQLFLQRSTLPKLLNSSPHSQTGPFEIRLDPGIHTILVDVPPNGSYMKTEIKLNGTTLLSSAYQFEHSGMMRLIGQLGGEQTDFSGDQFLPLLFAVEVIASTPTDEQGIVVSSYSNVQNFVDQHVEPVYVWISDYSLGHHGFPGSRK